MSTAQIRWQKEKTQRICLRFNRSADADILAYISQRGEPLQLIRRLIREEITRTGWTPPAAAPRPASLSLDGGDSYITPEELQAHQSAIADNWDTITAAMDPEAYADTDANFSPCSLPEFVAHYLERAGKDLILCV